MKHLRRRDIRAKTRRQRVPSEQDWEKYQDDLDQNHAHQMFAGRANEEVQVHFRNNVIETTDALRWMPKVPFQYYMIGFRDYMKSGNFKSTWASSSASCFLGLTLEKLERHPDHILAIMLELLPTIEYVANNQTKFEATERIYGNFPEIFKRIQTLHSALGG